METSSEWIIERTGIEERCWVSEGETGTTLARAAPARAALQASDLAEVHSTGLDVSTQAQDVTVLFGDGAGRSWSAA